LFSQGIISAEVLAGDSLARDMIQEKIKLEENTTGQTGYRSIISTSNENFNPSDFTVVYAVISDSDDPCLPFFSLLSFKHAATRLNTLRYKYTFSWIKKQSTHKAKS